MIRLSADHLLNQEMLLLSMEANNSLKGQDINDLSLSNLPDHQQADLRKEAISNIDHNSISHDSSIIGLHSSKINQLLHQQSKSHQEYTKPLRLQPIS